MAAPFSTVGGYGGNATVVLDPNTGVTAQQVDNQDGVPVLWPTINANGSLSALVIDPTNNPPVPFFWQAYPEWNAVISELRVISALLREQMGDTKFSYDLQTMRADEAWSTNAVTGAL